MARFPRAPMPGLLLAMAVLVGCGGGALRSRSGDAGAGGDGGPGLALPTGDAARIDSGPAVACVAEVHRSGRVPVDLLFLVDKSTSMDLEAGATGSKWELVREALMDFVRDPLSADLGVGLQFFPLVPQKIDCAADADCGVETCLPPRFTCGRSGRKCQVEGATCPTGKANDLCIPVPRVCRSRGLPACDGNYKDPVVPIAPLPGAAEPLVARFLATEPSGQTPMAPAVREALAHLADRQVAHPQRQVALVLATDGFPLGCEPMDIDGVSTIVAAAQKGPTPIPTFVIGVFSALGDGGQLVKLTNAGGTKDPFVIQPSDQLTAKFLAALAQIRSEVLPCEFTIPSPGGGELDFGKVNVRVKTATGDEELLYTGGKERCDPQRGGWYYDVNPQQGKPTRLVMCEATCQRFKADRSLGVDVGYGCKTRTIE